SLRKGCPLLARSGSRPPHSEMPFARAPAGRHSRHQNRWSTPSGNKAKSTNARTRHRLRLRNGIDLTTPWPSLVHEVGEGVSVIGLVAAFVQIKDSNALAHML